MIQAPNILEWGFVGRPPGLLNPPAGNYPTKDGWLAMTLVNQAQFEGICRALGRPDLITDARFTTNAGRKENVAALRAVIDGETVKRTTAEWLSLFEKENALAARINTYGDWLADPHVQQSGAAPLFEPGPGVAVPLPHLPGEPSFHAAAPKDGEHTRRILAEAGLDDGAIARMIAEGAPGSGHDHDSRTG
jgi:crotonobetainyl-CoA:carnitine CoA-transferase CaiB-like acyl-CoA transferase